MRFDEKWRVVLGHQAQKEPFKGVSMLSWDSDGISVSGPVVDEDVVVGPGDSWYERWVLDREGDRLERDWQENAPESVPAPSPDGRLEAVVSVDGILRVSRVATGAPNAEVPIPHAPKRASTYSSTWIWIVSRL